ncbi:LGFP repeat-containing protein [Actinomycetes bacterium M1A6_2h]
MVGTYLGLEVFVAVFERFEYEHPWIGPQKGDLMLGPRGGGILEYQNAMVFTLPDGGAHEVHGEILEWYLGYGGASGPLGYPISNEKRTPTGHGRYNTFENGTVAWLPGVGAFLMGAR